MVLQELLSTSHWATLEKKKCTKPCQALGFKSLRKGSVHRSDSRRCFGGLFKALDKDGVKSGKGGRKGREQRAKRHHSVQLSS